MKISKLQIKNFIGIQDLTMEPGKVNIIKGKNAKGKTSVLEAIEKAFTNNDRRPKVIRDGAESALIFIETNEGLTVRRSITDKGTNLIVKDEKGFNAPAPQKLLAGLTGQFNFNPVDFLDKDEKEQAKIILSAADIRVTPGDIIAWTNGELPPVDCALHGLQVVRDLHTMYYDRRREVNGAVKTLKAEFDSITIPEGFDPEEYRNVNLRDLYDQLKEAQDNNETITEASNKLTALNEKEVSVKKEAETEAAHIKTQGVAAREALKERMTNAKIKCSNESQRQKDLIRMEIKTLEEKIKRLKDLLGKEDGRLEAELKSIDVDWKDRLEMVNNTEKDGLARNEDYLRGQLVLIEQERADCEAILKERQPIDTAPLEKKVQEFQDKQGLVSKYDQKEEAKKGLENAKKEAERLDRIVKMLAVKPAELVKQANLPIEGLGIDEKGNVTINERPIKSLSTSEQIKMALDIARATAGKLKLICIDGFESIVDEAREELLRQIKEDDYQYFITEAAPGEVEISKAG